MNKNKLGELKKELIRITGIDFGYYKDDFFERCIINRMHRIKINTVEEYINLVKTDNEEVYKFHEFLSVYHSQFIRDPTKYQVLKEYVLPEIIKRNMKRELQVYSKYSLRIWSAGCAGGEEPYSIAMVVCEVLGTEIDKWNIDIIATDINEQLIEKAKKGIYHKNEFRKNDIDSYYQEKYFIKKGYELQVKDTIKDLVHFRVSNLITDKPVGAVDIIFCRNVLIYFNIEATRNIIMDFYNNIDGEGYLFLGNSEIIEDHFFCYFKKMRKHNEFIYKKIVQGTQEHTEAVKKQKDIRAGLGIE